MKVYRGFDGDSDPFGKESIIWFAVDPAVAFGYANRRRNPTVREYEISPKRSFDAGRSEQRVKVTELLSRALKQSRISKDKMQAAQELFNAIREEFGTQTNDAHHFWFTSKHFPAYLESLGFDSITATEDGADTIGILRQFKSMIK